MTESWIPQNLPPRTKRFLKRHAVGVRQLILEDGDEAPEELKPLFGAIAERFLHHDFDVNDLWRRCKVKGRTLTGKAFTQFAFETLGRYIRRHRCAVGAVLLVRTRLEIWKVTHAAGYANADGFSRAFATVYHQTPSDFRKKPGPLAGSEARCFLARPAGACEDDDETADEIFRARLDLLEALDRKVGETAAVLAADVHQRGAERAAAGDVDGAYEDLVFARRCDAAADQAQSRPLLLPCDTEAFFVEALCDGCRRSFTSDAARDLRHHMCHALSLVPCSLHGLAEPHCCDRCYRLIWDAVERARLGLLDDAFRAWWLSEHAADGGPASHGLFIRLMRESETLAHRDPHRRLKLCRRARSVAEEMDDADLVNLAGIFEGNALRALSRFHDAREVFNTVDTRSRLWLEVLYLRYSGTLETDDQDLEPAVEQLRRGAALFQELDPHVAALTRIKLAEALKWKGEFQAALTTFEGLIVDLDLRRRPEAADFVAIEHALHLIAAGEHDRAEQCLDKGSGASFSGPSFTAAYGELRLAQGKTRVARRLLEKAIAAMLEREKYDDAVVLTLGAAETHAVEGSPDLAIETAMTALTYSVSGARTKQTLQAISQLADYSGSAAELAKVLRKLAWQSGGVLPPAGWQEESSGFSR